MYIAGRPHVLRLINRPLENMEHAMTLNVTIYSLTFPSSGLSVSLQALLEPRRLATRKMCCEKLEQGTDASFPHDETVERPNVVILVSLWETISAEDTTTPCYVFDLMTKEGYNVCSLNTYKKIQNYGFFFVQIDYVEMSISCTRRHPIAPSDL